MMANVTAMSSLLGSKAAGAARPSTFTGKRTSRVQVQSHLQTLYAHASCVIKSSEDCEGLSARAAAGEQPVFMSRLGQFANV